MGAGEWFIDSLPRCPQSGTGRTTNVEYENNGEQTRMHELQDVVFTCQHPDRPFSIYVLIDAYDTGRKLAEYAVQKIVYELYLEAHIDENTPDHQIRDILKNAFLQVDSGYFESIGGALAKNAELKERIAGLTLADANRNQPGVIGELEQLGMQISGGATAVVAIVVGNRLFVANVGNSRALICRKSQHTDQLTVTQLSTQHDVDNADEALRLRQLGLPESVLKSHWAFRHTTRCLGDYRVKGGYKEEADLAVAKDEPHIADPEINGPFVIDDSYRFLVLMSAGLYNAWEAATSSHKSNSDIAGMVATEFPVQSSVSLVAQAVVDSVSRVHHEAFTVLDQHRSRLKRREDMTICVRNFQQQLRSVDSQDSFVDDCASMPHFTTRALPTTDQLLNNMGMGQSQSEATFHPDATYTPSIYDGDHTLLSSKSSNTMDSLNHSSSDDGLRDGKWPINENGRLKPYVSFDTYYALKAEHDKALAQAAANAV